MCLSLKLLIIFCCCYNSIWLHTIVIHSFSLEAHAVYFNEKYSSFKNAFAKQDGLAVLTVFAKVRIHLWSSTSQLLFINFNNDSSYQHTLLIGNYKDVQLLIFTSYSLKLPVRSRRDEHPQRITTRIVWEQTLQHENWFYEFYFF